MVEHHADREQAAAASSPIRPCAEQDAADILRIINAAAVVYRGVIPADRWHDPYMSSEELQAEMAAGVRFTGYREADTLVGVMGIQQVRNVSLIRHAYVLPEWQGHRIGSQLLDHLGGSDDRPILIGTWAAARWAIGFYERQGFRLVAPDAIAPLLRAYWDVPERQIETSVVLASRNLSAAEAAQLIADGFSLDHALVQPDPREREIELR